jgi:hypothetical protein
MLLKTIIKLLLASVGIVLLNGIIYFIFFIRIELSQNWDILLWGDSLVHFLKNLLFSNYFNGIPFSIVISIIGFISYVVYDYYKYKEEEKSLKEIIISDLSSILIGIIIVFFVLAILWLVLFFLQFLCFFFIITQYYRGWNIFLLYFKEYSSLMSYARFSFAIFSDFTFFEIFNALLFLIFLYFSFLKFKDGDKPSNITYDELPIVQKFFISILKSKVFQKLYLFYITPTVLVWLCSTLLSWFGLTQEKSPISLNILSTLFLFGLLLVIFKINRNNKKVKRELLKEEIKKEVMDEINNKI